MATAALMSTGLSGERVRAFKSILVISNGSSESSSTNSQEGNLEKSDGTHQLVTGEQSNKQNGNDCDTDDHIQTSIESCCIGKDGGGGIDIQIIGTVGGIEIDDCPAKYT